MKKHPVVHFEMPADNRERAIKFYSEAFGWEMNQLGPEMDNYILAATAETNADGMPSQPGTINGGIYQRGDGDTATHLVISVDNLDTHIEIVRQAGGEILGEPMDIPGIGRFIMIKDTEGNKVGLLQPVPMQ